MELSTRTFLLCLLSFAATFLKATGYYLPDPNGHVLIRWDILSWTPDGYVAVVNVTNYQKYRPVVGPGWKLQWTWSGEEVIWTLFGAKVFRPGNCSRFKDYIPQSCSGSPMVADLSAAAPVNMKVDGCCKDGILLSRYQGFEKSTTQFQISVGSVGKWEENSNMTVHLPRNFKFVVPRGGYSCSAARRVAPTRFISADQRRVTRAIMTWEVRCTFTPPLASKVPSCCVSLSSDQGKKKKTIQCPTCACSCSNASNSCHGKGSKKGFHGVPRVKCTDHMCPVAINWHQISSFTQHNQSRVLVTVSNLNSLVKYSDWIMLVEHPAMRNLTEVIHANHRMLPSAHSKMEVLWGIKNYNRALLPFGTKASSTNLTLLFHDTGARSKSPGAIFFNGDKCIIPPQA